MLQLSLGSTPDRLFRTTRSTVERFAAGSTQMRIICHEKKICYLSLKP